eukprot:Partr_v1_DN28407_c0_g1_i1_m41194 putative Nitrilase family, member 2
MAGRRGRSIRVPAERQKVATRADIRQSCFVSPVLTFGNSPSMKVACLQFYPLFKRPRDNMQRAADLLLVDGRMSEVDILVLPEMAFAGYCFESRADVEPFLESPPLSSPTFDWARQQSRLYNCYISVGFALKDGDRYFNALMLVDPRGDLVHVYRKHFLYETDEQWASEGPAFQSIHIDELGCRVGFGICMDLNPHKFQAPFDAFEFSSYHQRAGSRLILCSMNWLTHDNKPRIADKNAYENSSAETLARYEELHESQAAEDAEEGVHSTQTLRYWLLRMSECLDTPVTVVICNRIGREKESTFVGNSCVLDMNGRATGDDFVKGVLRRRAEGLLVADT